MKRSFFSAIGSPGLLVLGSYAKHHHLDLGDPGVSAGGSTSSAGDLGYPDGNGALTFLAGDGTSSAS